MAAPEIAAGIAPVRIGTRGSELALTQTGIVADAVSAAGAFDVELVRVRTEGDVHKGSLSRIGGTGVFVTALRDALLAGRCDIAVHSLKDLPTLPAAGLSIAAIPLREDVRDALCARDGLGLADLPAGARIGTGSPRRAAQLLAARPDIEVVDIRGNVGTRLARVAPGDLDAVVLAAAGLSRLGRTSVVSEFLDPAVMLPAPGQGALAVECRAADAAHTHPVGAALAGYDDVGTRLAVTAERALLARLEAGCAAPIGALGRLENAVGNGTQGHGTEGHGPEPSVPGLILEAVVCSVDGTGLLRREERTVDVTESGAVALGVALAEALLAEGAAELANLTAR